MDILERAIRLIEIVDAKGYNASKMTDEQLADDFRILAGWASTLKTKGEFKYDMDTILDLTADVIRELLKRGKTTFHPETWTLHAKELYLAVFEALKSQGIEIPENISELLKENIQEQDELVFITFQGRVFPINVTEIKKNVKVSGEGKLNPQQKTALYSTLNGVPSADREGLEINIRETSEMRKITGSSMVMGEYTATGKGKIDINKNTIDKGALTHEIGHSAFQRNIQGTKNFGEWHSIYKSSGKISDYGEKNTEEGFAEAYRMFHSGQRRKLKSTNPQVYEYFSKTKASVSGGIKHKENIHEAKDEYITYLDREYNIVKPEEAIFIVNTVIENDRVVSEEWVLKNGAELKEVIEYDPADWDIELMSKETNEELLGRLRNVNDIFKARGSSPQDEEIINIYILLRNEINKRGINVISDEIKELDDLANQLQEGIRPAFGSSGGKKYLAKTICSYIPDHKVYVEPFIGGGAVLFCKKPSEKEAINDLDKEISGAYKYIQAGKFEGLSKYRKDGDRDYFSKIKASAPKTLEEQYYKFIYCRNYSYANDGNNYAPSIAATGRTLEPRFEHLPKVADRIKDISIHNEDFRNLLKEYDSKDTFFYLDPPYPEQQGQLKTDLTNKDLMEAVKTLKGKWMMSLPDTPSARKIFEQYFIEGVEVRRTFNMATSHKDMELLISNYPLKQTTTWLSEGYLDGFILDTKEQIDNIGPIILAPNYVSWSGSTLYVKDRIPNDADFIIRDKEFPYHYMLKLTRLLQKLIGETPCMHVSPSCPNWRYFPLYHLALIPVKDAQFVDVGKEEPGLAEVLSVLERESSDIYSEEERYETRPLKNTKFKEFIAESKKPLDQYPKNYAILVSHFRGKSSHLDFRRKQNGWLEGETIANEPAGLITEEVDTLEKGRKWSQILLKDGKFRPDMDPNQKVVMFSKARQPLEWINVREVVVDPGTVGATAEGPGVFITMDEGMAFPGAQRSYFREFFLDMGHFKQKRLVERLIGVGPEWDKPPKASTQWQCWIADDEVPYILSMRQRKDKRDYIPGEDEKAIPPWWEEKIKPEYRWWSEKAMGMEFSDNEKMKRLDLAFNDLIEKGILKHTPIEVKEEVLQESKAKFTLRFHWWQGQDVVRKMPAADSRYELLIDSGKDALDRWDFSGKFYGDPTKQDETSATFKQLNIQTPDREDFKKWLDWEGQIPPENVKLKKVKILSIIKE